MSSPTNSKNKAADQLPSNNEIWDLQSRIRQWLNATLPKAPFGTYNNAIGRPQPGAIFKTIWNMLPLSLDSFRTRQADLIPLPNKYTFMIRGWGCYAVANGAICRTTPNLRAILRDGQGSNILEVREVPYYLQRHNELKRNKTTHKFNAYYDGTRIGMVAFEDVEPTQPTETCLKIYSTDDRRQLVVRSTKLGQFYVFRDQSSPTPLCHIKTDPFELLRYSVQDYRCNIEFYEEAGITVQEQQLCTAAAFAHKICEVLRVGLYSCEECNENQQQQTGLYFPLNSDALV